MLTPPVSDDELDCGRCHMEGAGPGWSMPARDSDRISTVVTPRSIYIHVPFCAHRCGYCDFTLVAGKDHLADGYIQALELEIDHRIGTGPYAELVDTVFLGGGTPTQLEVPLLKRLLKLIVGRFPLATDAEFSVEANPDRLSADKLDVLVDAGVNRISLGVQSFDNTLLRVLEREHRQEDLLSCIDRVRQRFANVSFDLIFSVPGQSLESWQQTLDVAVQLDPTHISTYGLTFEKGTSFWTRREKGQLNPVEDDTDREMYSLTMDWLTDAGFEQYEISSFARPGFRCRHNQVYWNGADFWGFGPGAASLIDGERRMNYRSVTGWLKKVLAGGSSVAETERLDPDARARELLVLGLRQTDGIDRARFTRTAGHDPEALAGPVLERLARRGLVESNAVGIRLTREGRFFADSVAGELLSPDDSQA